MPIFFRDVENGQMSLFNFVLSFDSYHMNQMLCIISYESLNEVIFEENSWVKSPYVETIPSIAVYIIMTYYIIASKDKHPNSCFEIHFLIEISLRICLSFYSQKLIWNQHMDARKAFRLRFIFPLWLVLNNWFKCRLYSSQTRKSCSKDGKLYIVLITDFSSFSTLNSILLMSLNMNDTHMIMLLPNLLKSSGHKSYCILIFTRFFTLTERWRLADHSILYVSY